MKTKPLTFILFSAAMMFHAPHCAGQSNVVYYGANSNALNVAFADTSLSAKAKAAITADLNLCLREWGKTSDLRLGDKNTAGQLYNWKTSPHYPEGVIDFPENITSDGASGVALQITKELSDAYTNAFAFVAANSNIVAAAYKFVTLISSNGFAASVTPASITDYVLVKKYKPQDYIANYQELMEGCFIAPKWHQPSVLGFRHSGADPSLANLWLVIPAYTPPEPLAGSVGEWLGLAAIWHDGKWKLCFWGWDDSPR
ncbi:MAG: hypothetical protein FWG50_00790 [Kiritimatiellaeota bacterium]|nr:hypothetical protein [Kiritimatiellota bacterium]